MKKELDSMKIIGTLIKDFPHQFFTKQSAVIGALLSTPADRAFRAREHTPIGRLDRQELRHVPEPVYASETEQITESASDDIADTAEIQSAEISG